MRMPAILESPLFPMLFVCTVAMSSCTGGQGETSAPQTPVGETEDWQPGAGALAESMYRVITSEITGRTYEISVALPRGYDGSTETYPVLYTTDANGSFGTIVEATRILRISDEVPAARSTLS